MRSISSRARFVAITFATVAVFTPSLTRAVDVQPVVYQTQPVPTSPPWTFFEPSISLSGLSNTGKVSFWGGWNSEKPYADTGVINWQAGVLTDVARTDDPTLLPTVNAPARVTQPAFINAAGKMAFDTQYNPIDDSEDGVFVGTSKGTLALFARSGGANAPGTASPWLFVDSAAMNANQVVLYGRAGGDLGLWRGTNSGNIVRVAQEDVVLIPGTAQPIENLAFVSPLVTSTGTTYFRAGYGPNADETALLVGTNDANLQVVARTHYNDVPGQPAGTKFTYLETASINNAGSIVYKGEWGNPNVHGLFTTARGIPEPVTLGGITPVPGVPGQTFSTGISDNNVSIVADDRIFFTGFYDGINAQGIFSWTDGTLASLVLHGQPAPGTANTFSGFSTVNATPAGDLLFVAGLDDGRTGMWWLPAAGGSPQLVLIEGQIVDVLGDGSDLRPIAELTQTFTTGGPEGGQNRLFNDDLQFLVKLSFDATDTTRPLVGLYTGTVPEPALASLLLSTLPLLRRSRRAR